MTTYTKADRVFLEDLIDKQALNPPANSFSREANDEADPGPESSLSKRIRQYCKDNGWPSIIFPQTQDVRNFLPKGFPDAVIALPKGITLWIELKSKKGYLKEKQKETAIQLLGLKHVWVCLKTFKSFLQLIDKF